MLAAIVVLTLTILLVGAFASYAFVHPASQVLGKTVVSGNPQSNKIALTFDDGPGEATPQILDILKSFGIKATFFLCAQNVEKYPDLACRIADEGHEIGNHTYSHPKLIGMTPGNISHEIQLAQNLIERTTQIRPRIFRPPYGIRWFGVFPVLANFKLTTVMWCVSGVDWSYPADRITTRVLERTKNGSIILLHDGLPPHEKGDRHATAAALPEIVRGLRERFQFVTISDLT